MYKALYLKYKWYLIITVPMSILLGMASMSVIAIISDAIGNQLEQMKYGVEYFFIAIVILFVAGLVNDLLVIKMSINVSYDIQVKMIRRVIATPLAQLEYIGLPKVIATLTEDLETAEKFFHLLPVLIVNIAIVVFGIAYMAYLSLELLGIVLGFFLLGFFTIACLLWFTKKDRVAIRETTDVMMSYYQRVVLGAKELTLNEFRKHFFTRKIFSTSDEIRNRSGRIFNLLAVVEQWAQLLVFTMLGVVIFLVGNYMSLSMEVITGYVITLLFLLEPIEVITNGFDELIDAKVAFNKMDSLQLSDVDGWDQMPPPKMSDNINSFRAKLTLESAEYAYALGTSDKTEMFCIGPISTQFLPGEVTLIIGGNGSGKSTLLKMLCGLYPLDSGRIYLNNEIIEPDNIEILRKNFSIITADFCLFEEILDANGNLCDDQIIRALLEKLNLSDLVTSTKGVLSNLDLSHGQRKRLALLQAYCESKPIILFDEWAADQDPRFKKIFYREILPALKKQEKTIIVVSHDNRYFDCADKVLKIEQGKRVAF
ncbi:MAG: cyclic peptide export ABC transporter [Gammaproteobacteria bacterium]|nr:cyclic peptide export ABC transporter [Gammaproteobacteria bacterium]